MEKVKLTAKQAFGLAQTSGKEWLKNQIFKNIRQAAEHGETHLIWDFEPCKYFFDEINDELRDLGYLVGNVGDGITTTFDISWENETSGTIWLGARKNADGFVLLGDLLRYRAATSGYDYLVNSAFDLISRAAEEGKTKIKMDVSDVPKGQINLICKRIEKQGLTVSYDESDNIIEISL